MGGTLAQKVLHMCGTMWAPMREYILSLLLQNPTEEIEKEAQASAGKAVDPGGISGWVYCFSSWVYCIYSSTWGWAPQVALVVKNPPAKAGDTRNVSLIPGLGRSPWGAHGNPLQYSWLESSMDRGAWWGTVYGATKSWTQLKQLSMHACTTWGYRPVWNCGHSLCLVNSSPGQTAGLSHPQGLVWNSHCSGHWMGRNDHWGVLSSSSMGSTQKNGIRMTEINSSLFKTNIQRLKKKQKKPGPDSLLERLEECHPAGSFNLAS